jgi:Flp pilus assembly pilin Flp
MTLESVHRRMAAYARDEGAATASEYALMLTILAGCGVILMHHLGHRIDAVFTRVAGELAH